MGKQQVTKSPEMRLWDLPQVLIERGREMAGGGHDIWLAGLGAAATAQEEGSHLFESLVKRGQKVEKAGKKQVESVRRGAAVRGEELVESMEESVYEPLIGALRRFGVSTRAEVRELSAKLADLTRQLDTLTLRLDGEPSPSAGPIGTVYYVVAREGGEGWVVRKEGRESAVSSHATKDDAVNAARAVASQHQPSRLSIYKKDGSLQDTFTYSG